MGEQQDPPPDPPQDPPPELAPALDTEAEEADVELERGEEPPNLEDAFSFTHGHRVRYDEVDAQGIVGHGSWMQILQLGRVEYLRYLGLMMEGGASSPVQAVVRRSSVDFLSPARFDDPLLLRVRCAQMGERSARIEYVVDNLDTGLRPLIGETTVVCVDVANFRSIPWPQVWRERVAELEQHNLQIGLADQ
jgi:acyl-CoA thioester hydrolase